MKNVENRRELLSLIDDIALYIEKQYGYHNSNSKHWDNNCLVLYLHKGLSTITLRYWLKNSVLGINYFSYPSIFKTFTSDRIKINPEKVSIEMLKKFVDNFMMWIFIKNL